MHRKSSFVYQIILCLDKVGRSDMLFVLFLSLALTTQAVVGEVETHPMENCTGLYARSIDSAIRAEISGDRLILDLLLWSSTQSLSSVAEDKFVVDDFPERHIQFQRDAKNIVVSLQLEGMGQLDGTYPRLEDHERHPADLLAKGRIEEAVAIYGDNSDSIELPLEVSTTFFRWFPSKSEWAVRFFTALAQRYPSEPEVYAQLGKAYVASGDRERALTAYRESHHLDSLNRDALLGLRRLGFPPDSTTGWAIPYQVDELLKLPTAAEIALVQERWRTRDLAVSNVVVELKEEVAFDHFEGTATILSHTVLDSRHYGVVFVPVAAEPASCPVLIEIKGVNPSYFRLDVSQGPNSLRILGEDSGGFVYVIPCLRGETMLFNEHRFESEGDRTNAWDGATDDTLALLSVALQTIPEADSTRVYCFGKSRGGTVALLAGQRDHRIKRVLAWSAPTDWFALMAYAGWSMREIVEDTLLNQWGPGEGGEAGQFVEWFVKPSIDGSRTLSEARLHILASSPLYFTDLLGRTQIHHGVEDNMVPVQNVRALIAKIESIPCAEVEFFLHPDAGHDVEYQPDEHVTLLESRAFLTPD